MALSTGNWYIAGATACGTTATACTSAPQLHQNTYIQDGQRIANLRLTMQASGWPQIGLNMPSYTSIGFYRNIAMYDMSPVMVTAGKLTATFAVTFALSSTGNKVMRCFRTILCSGTGTALTSCTKVLTGSQTFYVTARGW